MILNGCYRIYYLYHRLSFTVLIDGMKEHLLCVTKSSQGIKNDDFFMCKEFYRESTKHKCIESSLADYCLLKKLKLATFDLQASQHGGSFVLGNSK